MSRLKLDCVRVSYAESSSELPLNTQPRWRNKDHERSGDSGRHLSKNVQNLIMNASVNEQPQVHVRVRIPQLVVSQTGSLWDYFYLQFCNQGGTLLYF